MGRGGHCCLYWHSCPTLALSRAGPKGVIAADCNLETGKRQGSQEGLLALLTLHRGRKSFYPGASGSFC